MKRWPDSWHGHRNDQSSFRKRKLDNRCQLERRYLGPLIDCGLMDWASCASNRMIRAWRVKRCKTNPAQIVHGSWNIVSPYQPSSQSKLQFTATCCRGEMNVMHRRTIHYTLSIRRDSEKSCLTMHGGALPCQLASNCSCLQDA